VWEAESSSYEISDVLVLYAHPSLLSSPPTPLFTQVLVKAIVNSGPREDSTRVGAGGIVRRQAVDVSPFRRINQALYLIGIGAREASFRTIKTVAECLADEIVNASKGSSNSYAIKKKDELERVAKANR
jgi:small subunit ribosomal protein S5e